MNQAHHKPWFLERGLLRWGPFDTDSQAWDFLKRHQPKRRALKTIKRSGFRVIQMGVAA